jgi:hypothetical protein
MNVSRKIIFSLLISALIFAVLAAAAFTGFFDLVETRFYNPRMLKSLNREVLQDAGVVGALLDELRSRFTIVMKEEAVRRSFLPDKLEEDTLERGRIFSALLNSLPTLRSVRFVDAGGSRIHFSTLAEDVFRQDGSSPVYRSYRDCPDVLSYADVEAAEGEDPRLIFDGPGERLIFSYPFTDTLDVYRGSALFTFSVRVVAERMVQEGRIQVGEDVSVVSFPGGFLLGLPALDKEILKNQAALAWEKGNPGFFVLDGENPESLILVSAAYRARDLEGRAGGPGPETVFVGRLVRESIFAFPPPMKFVLLVSLFLTVFLLVFLLFNLRQDRAMVISSRLSRLQDGLFQRYREQKGMDWKHWARELEQRRGEIRAELKRDLSGGKKNSPVQGELDALIDRSWDEVVAAIGSYPAAGPGEEELRAIIADVLRRSGDLPPERAGEGPPVTSRAINLTDSLTDNRDGIGELEGSDLEVEPEILEELEAAEEPAGNSRELPGLAEAEEAEVLEELEDLEEVVEGKTGEIVVTPAAFAAGPEAELEPLEEASDSRAPAQEEDLDTLASEIEFSPETESEEKEGEIPAFDLASPFDSLSFESPSFSRDGGKEFSGDEGEADGLSAGDKPADLGEGAKKKHRIDGPREESGLTEITGDGGLPFIYQPFLFRGNVKPLPLRPLEDQDAEPIREQNGLHLVNSDILDPKLETADHLDPKFLRLVKSIMANKTAD